MFTKRILISVLLLAILVNSYQPVVGTEIAKAALPTIILIAPSGPQPGTQSIDVQVKITGATNLGAFEFDLIYDRSLVQVAGISLGEFLGEDTDCDPSISRCVRVLGPLDLASATGIGAYSFGTGTGASGEATLAVINLQPTGKSGTTALDLASALVTDAEANPVSPTTQGATLTLAGGSTLYLPLLFRQSITLSVNHSSGLDEGFLAASHISTGGKANAIATSPYLSCPDFNGDEHIDSVDLEATAGHWRQTSTDPEWDGRYDLDEDGSVSIVDIMKVSKMWGSQCQALPPDPSDVAPDLDLTVAADLFSATEFLYSGDNPIQTGVAPGTIDPLRVAVLRGKVMTRNGQPLPGVTITILDHPEYGQTLSRADGMFDMAVNGGGIVTVNYEIAGYLPAQRQVQAPWQNYAWLPDVVLVTLDSQVTEIDLSSNVPMQIARGSIVSDSDGSRQATLLVPQGTQAELVLPGGITQTLTSLDIRATEYTVGENGPEAMPAELPPQSGYTYALEYSVDEALAAGATDVVFSQPLIHYVENFLDFPVGMAVPTGYYDREQAAWMPSDNGRVIEILSITNGRADLDTDGDGAIDGPATLAALGVTDAERQLLASLYQAGQSLWRVPITHFTPWDCNWPYGPPEDGSAPTGDEPNGDEPIDEPCREGGSIIECQNQILGEAIGIVGTPFSLHYTSDRVPGRQASNTLEISLSRDTIPASLKRIDLEIEVAGQHFTQSFPAAPNQSYTFTWNGQDAYGRMLQGAQPVSVRIGYVYDAIYQEPAQFEQAFAAFSGTAITGNRARQEITLWQEWQRPIGHWDARAYALGGWTLSNHHGYDPGGRVLYLGNGTQRSTRNLNAVISTVAGDGNYGFGGDGGPATQAKMRSPFGVAISPDGSLYIADIGDRRIRRVAPDGTITTVAGNGSAGDSGDGGPATAASLSSPTDIAVGPDGSLYVVQVEPGRIRRVGTDGIITTVAGNGTCCYSGDGGPATQAQLWRPRSVAVAPDGSFYIADTSNNRIRRVSSDGIITTVAGNGTFGYSGDGGPATEAQLYHPEGVAVAPDGSLYIADSDNHRVRRVGLNGIITTVAGNGTSGDSGDGGLATEAQFRYPRDVAVGPEGSFYITPYFTNRVRQVGPDGIITTLAGSGTRAYGGDNGPAKAAQLAGPVGVTIGFNGNIYIADSVNSRIRMITPVMPGLSSSEIVVAAEDGSELYIFNGRGRHLRTLDALTEAIRYEFSYDGAGRLIAVTDGDGHITSIERDSDGNRTAVVGPFGQRTVLTLDPNGFLASIANPAGETHEFSYTDDGLLTAMVDPNQNRYEFDYDDLGRLLLDDDPAGGSQALDRTDDGTGYEVTRTTALNRSTTYRVEALPTGYQRQVNTFPDGTHAEVLIGSDGSRMTTLPDGTGINLIEGPDSRWGMLAPLPNTLSVITPGGLVSTTTITRSVQLAEPGDLLSLTVLTDKVSINGRTYTSIYDATSRTFTASTPEGRQRSTTIDTLGRAVYEQQDGLHPISYVYDDHGRLASITQGNGAEARTATLAYNDDGYLERVTDSMDRVVSFVYDNAGRVTQQSLPGGRAIGYVYDNNGNLTSITPPGRPAHTFTYTPVDLTATYTPPEVGSSGNQTVYTYNPDRQLTRIARPDGRNVDLGYDSAGRLETLSIERGVFDFNYDPSTGNLATVTAPDGGILSYSYDGFLLTQTAWTGSVSGSVSRSYDNDFRITSLSVNGANPITFQYDLDNLLVGAGELNLNYNGQNGLLSSTTLGNVSDSWSYNPFAEPTDYSAMYNSTVLYDVSYNRDKLGRITEKSEMIGGTTTVYTYIYDLAGRLEEVRQDNNLIARYTYDANGNRLSFTGPSGTMNGSYDNQDRLLHYGSTNYTYTDNGELLTKTTGSQVTTYDYDELGNLIGVTLPDGTQIQHIIDGRNRRIGKRVNGSLVQGFLYQDSLNPIAELDGSGNVISGFVYGSRANVPDYMIRGGVTYRIISDHLGSPRLVVNSTTGEIVQRMDYDEFGDVVVDTNPGFQPFGFAGGIYDPNTGLTRFGARDYDFQIGRWTTKDPIGVRGEMNLYRYVDNNPVNLMDATGKNIIAHAAAELFVEGFELIFPHEAGIESEDELVEKQKNVDNDEDGIADSVDSNMDGDELDNWEDPDIDGDGIPNELDREPYIPLLPLEIFREFEEIQREKNRKQCP